MDYEGWVPNATGNLSFGAVGNAIHRRVLFKQHLRGPSGRWVIIAQERPNRDRLIPGWLDPNRGIPNLPKGSKSLRAIYVLVVKSDATHSDPEGRLTGVVACLAVEKNEVKDALASLTLLAATFKSQMKAARLGAPMAEPSEKDWIDQLSDLKQQAAFCCEVTLLRNGKLFLAPAAVGPLQRYQIALVDQCYYFVKDAVHRHYHHSSASDGIIEVTAVGSNPDWRHRTIHNLYRKIIDLRANLDDSLLSNALGVLSYAETFFSLFSAVDFDRSGKELPGTVALPQYKGGLVRSIEVRKEEAARRNDRSHLDAQFVMAAVIATWAGLIGLYDHLGKGTLTYILARRAVDLLSYHPEVYVIAVGLLYMFYIARNRHGSSIKDRPTLRWIYRASAWLPKAWQAILWWLFVVATISGFGFFTNQILRITPHIPEKQVTNTKSDTRPGPPTPTPSAGMGKKRVGSRDGG